MQNFYSNIEKYNPGKKRKVLIIIDVITDMISKKKLNWKATELYIRGGKTNISFDFIMQSYFKVPKDVRLNCTHFSYYINSKQKRASTNCNNSFIRYWL